MSSQEGTVVLKVFQILAFAFIYISAFAIIIGPERKTKWFRRRTKDTFFTHRGLLGNYINFGYPCTWQGILVFVAIFGVLIPLTYWYVFI